VVSPNCLVDESSLLCESVVFPGSYVGQGLELNDAIVNRNRLVNVAVGAAITVTDNFILGNFVENKLGQLARAAVSRGIAIILLSILWPVLLVVWLWRAVAGPGPAVTRKSVVRMPAADASDYSTYNLLSFCPSCARHSRGGGAHELLLHFLPGLICAARGDLSFVGVAPRTAEEIEKLPGDWQRLYLGSVAGLITESYVVHGPSPSEDALYSAEVFYTAMASPKHDLALIAGYFARVVGLRRSAPALETMAEPEEQ
jgi:lipopolysaccharide/colanic/teichoic acid biosynthesis glycosyltransferase